MKTRLLSICALALTLSINAQTDPGTTNLKHAWTFEDGTAKDVVGTANGKLMGGAKIVDGYVLIDKAGKYVQLAADKIEINKYTALSVVASWNTLDTAGLGAINTGYHMLWYFGGSEVDGLGGTSTLGSNGIFLSPARGDDYFRTAISCGNVATPWTTESAITRLPEVAFGDSAWQAVTTINATYMSLYINGKLIDTANLSTDNHLANLKNDSAWIGRGGYGGDPNYLCKVQSISMYDKELTADEVLFLYNNKATDVKIVESAQNIGVYAANGNIYINNLGDAEVNSIQIYSLTGSLIMQADSYSGAINVDLPSNLYIVKVRTDKGNFTSKVLVK